MAVLWLMEFYVLVITTIERRHYGGISKVRCRRDEQDDERLKTSLSTNSKLAEYKKIIRMISTEGKTCFDYRSVVSTKINAIDIKINGNEPANIILCKNGESENNEDKKRERVCSPCNNEFINETQFLDHLGIHGIGLAKNSSTLDNNKARNNKDEPLFEQKNENGDSITCVVRPFKCCLCELVFDRISQLDNHKRSVHGQERSQVCQICGKGFFRQTDLKTHLNIHLGTHRCICEVCGRKFNHMSNLIRHSRTHSGVKPYPCTICGKRFTQINSLARHKAIHGRGDEIMDCFFCDKHYKSDGGLKEHMKKSHGFVEKSGADDNGKIVKRKHYCKICGESFQFVELLRLHDKSHENLETFECKSCNQKFRNTDEIKEHRCGRSKFVSTNQMRIRKSKNVVESISSILKDKEKSNLRGENIESVHSQLSANDKDSEELINTREIYNVSTEIPRISEMKIFTDNELDYKLSQTTISGSNKLTEDKRTTVYVTAEQLANMNTEQVVDTANHFLHEHLMELAVENSLQSDNVGTRDCDEETVVSEMINSCWKEIEMPDESESEIAEKRTMLSCKSNTQSIVYVQALEKDGLIFLNETSDSLAPDLTPEKFNNVKQNSSGMKDAEQIENTETLRTDRNQYVQKNFSDTIHNQTLSKKLTELKLGSNKSVDHFLSQNHKQERNIRGTKGVKTPNMRHYFNEDDNLPVETANPSLSNNMLEELLKNNNDNVNGAIGKSSESQEPTLRLVQTENGEEFYELLITNDSDKSENAFEFDRIPATTPNDPAPPESLLKFIQIENGQRVFELMKNNSSSEPEISRLTSKSGKTEEIEESNPNATFIDKGLSSVLENVEEDEIRAKNYYSPNKSEKIFYLAQNNKDNSIDFFEIETLGTQEQNSFNLGSDKAAQNVARTNFDNLQTLNRMKNSENEPPIDNESCDSELLQLIQSNHHPKQNLDKRRSECEKNGPMVRLVQNEDGAQFFELIRGDLEFDETQNFEVANESKEFEHAPNSKLTNNAVENPKILTKCAIDVASKFEADSNRKKKQKSNGKIYNCDVCKKSFSKGYNYRQHIGIHFADQQKFKCKECGMFFAWKSTLNKHMATHRSGGQQKYVCEICPKVYTTLSQVNEHVKRDHLKERNHKCAYCAKKFFKKSDLKIHIRTHTKERPYECSVCYKSFHHQSHIIRHERIHSGERPYACRICEKTFTQLGSLKNHKQRHKEMKIDILDYQMDEDDPLP